jgi:hypothetical protein
MEYKLCCLSEKIEQELTVDFSQIGLVRNLADSWLNFPLSRKGLIEKKLECSKTFNIYGTVLIGIATNRYSKVSYLK